MCELYVCSFQDFSLTTCVRSFSPSRPWKQTKVGPTIISCWTEISFHQKHPCLILETFACCRVPSVAHFPSARRRETGDGLGSYLGHTAETSQQLLCNSFLHTRRSFSDFSAREPVAQTGSTSQGSMAHRWTSRGVLWWHKHRLTSGWNPVIRGGSCAAFRDGSERGTLERRRSDDDERWWDWLWSVWKPVKVDCPVSLELEFIFEEVNAAVMMENTDVWGREQFCPISQNICLWTVQVVRHGLCWHKLNLNVWKMYLFLFNIFFQNQFTRLYWFTSLRMMRWHVSEVKHGIVTCV